VLLIAFACLLVLPVAHAASDRAPPLDRAYRGIEHPIDDTLELRSLVGDSVVDTSSDFAAALAHQSEVKSQEDRGTCSIFSTLAWMESYLLRNRLATRRNADLSEEWLQYLVARDSAEDGSETAINFAMILKHGLARESALRYDGRDWSSKEQRDRRYVRGRCGYLPRGRRLKACLLGHFDPEALDWSDGELRESSAAPLLQARREAARFLKKLKSTGGDFSRRTTVNTVSEAKRLLRAGIPLVLDIDFYYGAWNHQGGEDFGIPSDDMKWEEGVISYPAHGSVDRKKSLKDLSGHSVLAVGYDDTIEVEVQSLQEDGSVETLRYRGVYFIKNSWGTRSFGSKFRAQGVKAPGYGMITQKYAHEFGGFYRLQLPESSR